MVRRLILCADNRSPYNEADTYYKYCIGVSQVYAKKYNADFVFDELKSVPDGRHWAWARILLFAKYYPKYDEILWLDSDATIINHDVDVFSLLKTANAAAWERDGLTQPMIYACRDTPNKYFCCTGILLLDCTNKSKVKDLLNDWWNDIPDAKFKTAFPYEQAVINNVWRIHPVKRNYVKTVDLDSFFYTSDKQAFIHLTSNFYVHEVQLHDAKKYAARLMNKRSKKIGIFMRQQNFYSSGCSQNCIFIKQSLELLGYTVDLLVEHFDKNKDIRVSPSLAIFLTDLKTVNINDYELFIFGSVIPSAHVINEIKEKRIKTVMFHPMNSIDALHIDTFVYPKKADTVPLFETGFHKIADEVWLTNNHTHSAKTYIDLLNSYKTEIKPIPLTWAPLFVTKDVLYQQRKSSSIEFVIIEPNMSYCKNAWFPLMIAEYAQKKYDVKAVHLFSSQKDTPIIESLQLAKDKKISFRPRIQITEIIKQVAKGDTTVIFLSHQVNIPLNYAYFDILSTGFPFIHNSPKLLEAGQGYYYTSLETAADAIESILKSFSPIEERKKVDKYLQTINPGNQTILNEFSTLISTAVPSVVMEIPETSFVVRESPRVPKPKRKICVAVLTTNKERELFMRKQMEDMNLPFSVDIFQGFTPATSKEYLASKETSALEDNGTLCCFRSYAALFNKWSSQEYDFLITLEDDVILSKDFLVQLNIIIDEWEKEPSVDYINIGYLLGFNLEELNTTDKNRLYFNNLPSMWGGQGMIFKPEIVKQLASILHHSSVKEVRESLGKCKSRKLYRNRELHIQIDAILPTLFRQGVQYPPIVMESLQFPSSRENVNHNANNKHLWEKYPEIKPSNYYGM